MALAPDSQVDCIQCWSGHAVETDNNKLAVMYTGLHPDADGKILQTVCLAESEDGDHFIKYPGNPVISGPDLPEGSSWYDFRDPKVFRVHGGYRLLAANRGEQSGRQLQFFSEDLKHWSYEGIFLENVGDMPECPDYFTLDNRQVLLTCVMGMKQDGYRFQNEKNDVIYIIGQSEKTRFTPEVIEEIDKGIDFYAPQTVLLPDGQRVMIAWMQMWGEVSPTHTLGHGWNGAMTFPRVITLRGNRLYQRPVDTLEQMLGAETQRCNIPVNGDTVLPGISGRHYRLRVEAEVQKGQSLEIRLLQTEDEYFSIAYNAATALLTVDRSHCGYLMGPEDRLRGHAQLDDGETCLKLDILVDTCSVEVFAQDGAVTQTALAFPKGEAMGISFTGMAFLKKVALAHFIS